ncbi:hypothetical protein ACFY36_04655 [Actinoplanes sp. NPDC000266]
MRISLIGNVLARIIFYWCDRFFAVDLRGGVPSHSPEMLAFRRDAAERRRRGLKRRHALKLCRLHGCSRLRGELGLPDPTERIPPLVWDDEVSWVRRRDANAARIDGSG